MKTILRNLIQLFFPNLCVVCNEKLVDGEQHICIGCLSNLPKTAYHLQKDNRLEDFFAGRILFQRIAAYTYFIHEGSVQKIVHELKYNNNPAIGQYIGELCGNEIKESDFVSDIDLIVPIPLHPKRLKQRGYNQSLEISKGISKKTNIPINSIDLIRIVNNKSQTQHSRDERWKNVENIFAMTNPKVFENKHILLIDDIITTGSTIESCAKELLKSKGCRVSIYAFGVAQ